MILSGWETEFYFQKKIFIFFINSVTILSHFKRENIIFKYIIYNLVGYLVILAQNYNFSVVISEKIIGLE